MPYTSIAIAAQLLASDRVLIEQAVLPVEPGAMLVERTSADGTPSELSVWMPILADGRTDSLNGPQLRRLAKETERIVSTEKPSFVVDEYRAGTPRIGSWDGGVAGDSADAGLDITVSVFAASSIPPDLQLQLRAAVAEVERYFESTLRNSALGPGGVPEDITLRLALRVTALASNVPGASQFRTAAVRMSDLTRRLNEGSPNDSDDYQPAAPGYLDRDGRQVGTSSLRVRYSSVSTAVSGENRVYLTRAQLKALGFPADATGGSGPTAIQFDGTILMNSGFQWDYDPSDGVTLNQVTRFSFQDYFARELLIQLGWVSGVEFLQRDMTLMDMFRFSSVGPNLTMIGPDLDLIGLEPINSWPFHPPLLPPPPGPWIRTPGGSAQAANAELASRYSSGQQSLTPPLDYNPGLDRGLIALATALNDSPGVDAIAANLVSGEVVSPFLVPGSPDFIEAQKIVLSENLHGISGLLLPMPQVSIATSVDELNRYDDAEWPAAPLASRTRYPDGAVPRVVSWPTPPLVQWDFNSTATVGPATNLAAPSIGAGTLRAVGGGITAALLSDGIGGGGASSSDPSEEGKTMQFTGLEQGRSIEVRCDTAGAAAPSVSFDIRLSPRASSTWRLSYSVNANVANPTYATLGLENDGYIDLSGSYPQVRTLDDPDGLGFVCRVRFELPGPFTPGTNTGFRLSPVPPPNATAMESVAQARGLPGRPFDAAAPVEIDMVTVYSDVAVQMLVDYNPSFRGHMPRLVARGARSHLNFGRRLLPPDPAPTPFFDDLFDNEIEVGTGNNFNNSRAAFLAQTSGAIPPWERFLMGQSSTSGLTTIPRGITFWTRDPVAYASGPGTKLWQFRGELPDFLSYEELLVLDHLGWDIVADVLDPTGSAGRNGAVAP